MDCRFRSSKSGSLDLCDEPSDQATQTDLSIEKHGRRLAWIYDPLRVTVTHKIARFVIRVLSLRLDRLCFVFKIFQTLSGCPIKAREARYPVSFIQTRDVSFFYTRRKHPVTFKNKKSTRKRLEKKGWYAIKPNQQSTLSKPSECHTQDTVFISVININNIK